MKTLVCLFSAIGIVHFAAAYSPIIDGATADVRIKVVDDMGEAVPDATISVTFYTAPEKVDIKRGTTDTQGYFSAKGRCIGEAHTWIRKDGYYETKVDPTFRVLPDKDAECLRKWSNGTVETTATLKKKRNPDWCVMAPILLIGAMMASGWVGGSSHPEKLPAFSRKKIRPYGNKNLMP